MLILRFCILLFAICLPHLSTSQENVQSDGLLRFVRVTDEITRLDITEKCLFYTGDNVPLEDSTSVIQKFIDENFQKNHKDEILDFGKYPEAKTGWVYVRLVNSSKERRALYVQANFRRSDGLSGYVINEDLVKSLGEVKRSTPLHERAFPSYELHIPVEIAGRDTCNLLIRSERFANRHILGLALNDKGYYERRVIDKQQFEVANGSILAFIVIVFVIFSVFLRDKLLLALAFFFATVLLIFLSFRGYFDFWDYPENVGLSASNITGFLNFIANVAFHPLTYLIVADSIRKKRLYLWVSGVLILLNIIFAACYLVESSVYYLLDNYINYGLGFLASINILWAIIHSYLHFRRSGRVWYLIATLSMLLPLAIKYILEACNVDIFRTDDPFAYFSSYILIFAFSYIAFQQLKIKLILRSKADKKLSEISQSLNEINVNEITKIGRNLHDQVGNTLASALGYLNMKESNLPTAKKLIEMAIKEIRLVSHNIVKQDAENFTTWHIEQLVERMNDFSVINYHFEDYSNESLSKLPAITKQNVYVIIQELLTNILKHSKASDAFVEIFDDDNKLQINVEDNGVGFDSETDGSGIGLVNIKSRAEILGFHYVLESTERGVSVLIEIDYEEN